MHRSTLPRDYRATLDREYRWPVVVDQYDAVLKGLCYSH